MPQTVIVGAVGPLPVGTAGMFRFGTYPCQLPDKTCHRQLLSVMGRLARPIFFFGKEAKTSACGPGKENDHDMAIYHLEAKVITRAAWADAGNRYLEKAGREERIARERFRASLNSVKPEFWKMESSFRDADRVLGEEGMAERREEQKRRRELPAIPYCKHSISCPVSQI